MEEEKCSRYWCRKLRKNIYRPATKIEVGLQSYISLGGLSEVDSFVKRINEGKPRWEVNWHPVDLEHPTYPSNWQHKDFGFDYEKALTFARAKAKELGIPLESEVTSGIVHQKGDERL